MLEQPMYRIDDARVRALVHENPWAILVSEPESAGADPVISHIPILQDPDSPGPVVLSHIANQDVQAHGLGERRAAVLVQGVHGYISPTWYEASPYVPSWDFLVAHLHGTPEILDAAETFAVLDATCARMESDRVPQWSLSTVPEYARRIAPGVTGFRLRPDRIVGKAKMSQDKPPEILHRIVHALRTDPYHGNPRLADEVARSNDI
jgi:transcriptional regulator